MSEKNKWLRKFQAYCDSDEVREESVYRLTDEEAAW